MTAQMSEDPAGSDESQESGFGKYGNAGEGAASALERMKSERERRRGHGRSGWPQGNEEQAARQHEHEQRQ